MSFRDIPKDPRDVFKTLIRRIDDLERKRELPFNTRIIEKDDGYYILHTITGEETLIGSTNQGGP